MYPSGLMIQQLMKIRNANKIGFHGGWWMTIIMTCNKVTNSVIFGICITIAYIAWIVIDTFIDMFLLFCHHHKLYIAQCFYLFLPHIILYIHKSLLYLLIIITHALSVYSTRDEHYYIPQCVRNMTCILHSIPSHCSFFPSMLFFAF